MPMCTISEHAGDALQHGQQASMHEQNTSPAAHMEPMNSQEAIDTSEPYSLSKSSQRDSPEACDQPPALSVCNPEASLHFYLEDTEARNSDAGISKSNSNPNPNNLNSSSNARECQNDLAADLEDDDSDKRQNQAENIKFAVSAMMGVNKNNMKVRSMNFTE